MVTLILGNITEQETDAIVNAANSSLLGGGGVDGAIHRAGGPAILEECRAIRARQGTCAAGNAVITGGGKLKARFVLHAVGPVWEGGAHHEDELLESAYRNSLLLAVQNGARSISFPSISTGAYGFPIDRAARIAIATVREFLRTNNTLKEIRFVVFSPHDREVYASVLQTKAPGGSPLQQI
jgi:O-acetyl-ADP-ribose deacetylase (regulator of RNase III)